ncbi:MAG: hypothetical protein HC794_06830 [Nitrospiraceae bacterium]|nr:hypothetical protein [Nitrospiraceae bacterium]
MAHGKGNLTFAVWIKTTSNAAQCILSGVSETMDDTIKFHLMSSTRVRFYHNNVNREWTVANLADNQWHHLVVVRDKATNKFSLYRNGVHQGDQSITLTDPVVTALVLGEEQDPPNGNFESPIAFVGSLDEAMFFDRVLTGQEVLTLYQSFDAQSAEPRLVSLYEFVQPDAVTPSLVAHWPLDEPATIPGQMVTGGQLRMFNQPIVDSYNSASGTYSATAGSNAWVATNATTSQRIYLSESAIIKGSAFVGVGGSTSTGIYLTHSASISATQGVLLTPADTTVPSPPTITTTAASRTDTNGSTNTLSGTLRYGSWTVNNNATVNVSGNAVVHIDGNVSFDSSTINIPTGSSLTLYVGGDLTAFNQNQTNNDSQATGRLKIYAFNTTSDITVDAQAVVAGSLHAGGNVIVKSNAIVYGKIIAAGNITVQDSARVRLDTAMATPGGLLTAAESVASNIGGYRNGAAGGASGPTGGSIAATCPSARGPAA